MVWITELFKGKRYVGLHYWQSLLQSYSLCEVDPFWFNFQQGYLQKLIAVEKDPSYQHVAIRCICTLLDAVPHFNFRESLIEVVTRNLTSSDDVIRFKNG